MHRGLDAFSIQVTSRAKTTTVSIADLTADTLSVGSASFTVLSCSSAAYGSMNQQWSLSVPLMFAYSVPMDTAILGGEYALTISGQDFEQWSMIMDHAVCTPTALNTVTVDDTPYSFYCTDIDDQSVTAANFEPYLDGDIQMIRRASTDTQNNLVVLGNDRTYYFGAAYSVFDGTPLASFSASMTVRGWLLPPMLTLSSITVFP